MNGRCPFCAEIARGQALLGNSHAVALPDAYPVTPGHTLVVSRAHVADLFELDPEQRSAVWQLVAAVRQGLLARGATAFNVGANVGEAAGQTIAHAHVHVIPRTAGDVEDPRGGVRGVIAGRAVYDAQSTSADPAGRRAAAGCAMSSPSAAVPATPPLARTQR